jgi:glycosyltransferase involved in cell wall biosynthesis
MISVCIPTYNGQEYIAQQIESILRQLEAEDEIVISDDNSTDSTIEIIKTLNDNRIKIYYNNGKNGVINNIENALKKCKGDYIFLSDQDDVWLENKVSVCMHALQKAAFVVSDCHIVNQKLEIVHDSFYKTNKSHKNKWLALLRNPYLGCCLAFQRSILERALPFPNNTPMHDIWLGNVAAFFYTLTFVDDKLILYRRHGNNASTSSEPTKASAFKMIMYRAPLFWGLLKIQLKKTKINTQQ